MPKRTMYPCQYPDCQARYDETLDGKIEGTGAVLTGWIFPYDAETVSWASTNHEHILNVMHKVEVDTDIHDMTCTGCTGLTADPDGPQLEEK